MRRIYPNPYHLLTMSCIKEMKKDKIFEIINVQVLESFRDIIEVKLVTYNI